MHQNGCHSYGRLALYIKLQIWRKLSKNGRGNTIRDEGKQYQILDASGHNI